MIQENTIVYISGKTYLDLYHIQDVPRCWQEGPHPGEFGCWKLHLQVTGNFHSREWILD